MAQFAIALDWMMEKVVEGDQVIIYFSGHGDVEKKAITQPGFLLCWDAPAKVYMAGGAFALPFLQEVVSTLSTKNKANVLVITDACRSGKLAGSSVGGAQITGANLAKQYANETKILSCQPNEYSLEGEQWGGGRGAFSYHLVNGLYGMADANNDLSVNLMEIGRYLEDKVIPEVAPQSQVPMTIGNRMGNLATVAPDILEQLKDRLDKNLPMLSATSSRGIEDEVLASVSNSLKEKYAKFKELIADKIFLEPAGECANTYYEELIADSELEKLHSHMRRNFAAALQDDAQQAINIWLEADASAVECLDFDLKGQARKIARQLEKAAALLGSGHYMYKPLKARQYLFEGKALKEHDNVDEELAQKVLSFYRKATSLEPQSPMPWFEMVKVYTSNIIDIDSAFLCAEKATDLAPTWILPYTDLARKLNYFEDSLEIKALEKAQQIDSLHPYTISCWGSYYSRNGNPEKAIQMHDQFRESGADLYPCWYVNYSHVLKRAGKSEDAKAVLLEAISKDSSRHQYYGSLASIYGGMQQWEKGEKAALKAIELDSTYAGHWDILGYIYNMSGRFDLGIPIFKKTIEMEPHFSTNHQNLGFAYMNTGRHEEATAAFEKAIELDPKSKECHINMAQNFMATGQNEKAVISFDKAIAADTSFWMSYAFASMLDINMENWERAKSNLLKAIGLHSEETMLHSQLGLVYLHLPDHLEQAEQALIKAISFERPKSRAFISMAKVAMRKNDREAAWGHLEKGLEIKFNNYEELQEDEDLKPLHADKKWEELMQKYFPEQEKK